MLFPGILADGSLIATAASIRTSLGLGTADNPTFGNLTVSNLTVNGTTTTVNSATITVDDPLVRLADNNVADLLDIGLYGLYVSSGSKYAGIFRDATDGKFKLFTALQEEPTTTVNTAGTGYTAATFVCGQFEPTGDIVLDNSKSIYWSTRSAIRSPSNGYLTLLDSANNQFTMLQFGGALATMPALKVSSSELQCRLADDSAYGNFRANQFLVTATAASRESLIRGVVADSGTDAFFVGNGTALEDTFAPLLGGIVNSVNSRGCLTFNGFVSAANDASNSAPVVIFRANRSDSTSDPLNGSWTAVANRDLFAWRGSDSGGSDVTFARMDASGNFILTTKARLDGLSSTSTLRERADWESAAIDNTDATRKYRSVHKAYDTAAREYLRGWGDGTVGRIACAAPASAPTDAHLAASQISFYLDETGHNLLVRAKYADGTTLKLATIALA